MALAMPIAGHAYEPQVNYQLHCMGCHLADGSGETDRVPSVRKTLVPFSMLSDGRNYVLRVPGVAQSPLADADVAGVLNWMARNLSDMPVPAGFRDYDAREVRAVRGRPLAQVKGVRQELLERIGHLPEF
jgi:mono/diheme cytochrome c family protein